MAEVLLESKMATICQPKIIKKIQHLAFTEKVKIVNSYVPEKVKIFIEKNLIDELKYFQDCP